MKSTVAAITLFFVATGATGTTNPSWLASVRARIPVVFSGMEGDFHRERLEMRLEAAERLAALPNRTPLMEAELEEFHSYFREAFSLWAKDPLNPAVKAVTFNLSDFVGKTGVQPSSFKAAIDAIRALNEAPSILRIPAGDYFIPSVAKSAAEAGGLFHLDFSALTNCAIIGASPETTRIEFGVHGQNGITVAYSRNCSVVNLDLSWRESPFCQVAIEEYNPTNFTAVVRHHPGTMRPDDPRFLENPGKTEQVCMLYTPEGRYLQGRGACAYPFFRVGSGEDLGGGRFRIGFDNRRANIRAYRPLPGDVLCIPDRNNSRQGFRIHGSEFCNLHRVWFRNSPAGTVAGKRCRYITADHCRVFPKSSDLFLSSNADTFMVARGAHLAHCTFEHMGDDGANCLGEGFRIQCREGPRTVVVERFLVPLRIGDTHQIVHAIDGRILGDFRVESAIPRDGGGSSMPVFAITYDRDLPADLVTAKESGAIDRTAHYAITHGLSNIKTAPDIIFTPLAFGTGFTMRDCVIRGNRGCGLNVQCPHAVVEDNVFDNILIGMKMTGLTQWLEGPAPYNVVVRGNLFRDCRRGLSSSFTTANRAPSKSENPIRWIEIISNRFEHVEQPFSLMNTADVTKQDNIVSAERAEQKTPSLEQGFQTPPSNRHPEIWLFRFGTDTPDEVITYDLERLASVGIAGVTVYGFDSTDEKPYGNLALDGRPKAVKKFRWALHEANRLGMYVRLCIGPAGCGNEKMSPENVQKQLVLSSVDVDGGGEVRAKLPKGEIEMPKRCVWPRARTDFDFARAHWHDIRILAAPLRAGGARAEDILDVTGFFDGPSETLAWKAPPGRWRIVRAAWVPMKLGWVDFYIDPLRREAFDEHWAHVVQPILDAATPDELKAFKGVMNDSWEAGEVDWTQRFAEEFRKRRGYDVWPAIAAKAGVEISGAGVSARLLNDYGKTVSELFAENNYAYQKEVANRCGLESEAEACGPHQSMGDMRMMQARCDLATGEFWMPSSHRSHPQQRFMLRDVATCAHVYGLSDVRAESFTTMGTHWQESPAMLKPCADRAFCDGLTRIVWHGMLMSDPLGELPGSTRRAGAYYSPKVTWFSQSAPLNLYFSRCSWMLSRGRFAADCLLYMGDALGLFIGLKTPEDALGNGYDYDVCTTEVLLKAHVENGEIVLPSGMRYKVLYLSDKNPRSVDARARSRQPTDDTPYAWPISTEARAKIGELKAAGASILETRAERDAYVASRPLAPDFVAGEMPKGAIDWIHRTEAGGDKSTDIYFVSNQSGEKVRFDATFRLPPCRVELWDAVTGERRPVPCASVDEGRRTRLDLELAAGGSVFAVFRKGKPQCGGVSSPGKILQLPLDSDWAVSFDPAWGGPSETLANWTVSAAADWTLNTDFRIRFYSGSAVYRRSFDLPDGFAAGAVATLDLGAVRDVAEVRLNGESLGVLWTAPFAVKIKGLKAKGNKLEVRVTNLWVNRLVGDASLPEEKRIARTPKNPFVPETPLMPSGLLGPIALYQSMKRGAR